MDFVTFSLPLSSKINTHFQLTREASFLNKDYSCAFCSPRITTIQYFHDRQLPSYRIKHKTYFLIAVRLILTFVHVRSLPCAGTIVSFAQYEYKRTIFHHRDDPFQKYFTRVFRPIVKSVRWFFGWIKNQSSHIETIDQMFTLLWLCVMICCMSSIELPTFSHIASLLSYKESLIISGSRLFWNEENLWG